MHPPDGDRYRKYVQGKTYDEAQANWIKLRDAGKPRAGQLRVPELGEFLSYWLKDIVEPNLAPKTYEKYEMFSRLHIIPYLGTKRLDKIQVKDIRQWLNKLAASASAARRAKTPHGPRTKAAAAPSANAASETLSARSRKDARDTLRAALTCAVEDETIARNPVSCHQVTKRREPERRKRQAWTVDDARWFLESTWHAGEALYAAFVLVLVLGLRRGEVLGLAWDQVDLDAGELYVGEQAPARPPPARPPRGQDRDIRGTAAAARPVRRRAQAPQAAAGCRP